MIIITVLIPTFCALTALENLDFLFAGGIFLQFMWSTMLLIHILSEEDLFTFD